MRIYSYSDSKPAPKRLYSCFVLVRSNNINLFCNNDVKGGGKMFIVGLLLGLMIGVPLGVYILALLEVGRDDR